MSILPLVHTVSASKTSQPVLGEVSGDPDRFYLAHFPKDPMTECAVMPDWPVHLTILPWMIGDYWRALVNIRKILAGTRAIDARLVEEGWFVEEYGSHVLMAEPADRLRALHEHLYESIEEPYTQLHYLENEHIGTGFNAHITPKPGQTQIGIGTTFLVDNLTVVYKVEDTRVVGPTLPMGSHEA